MSGKRNSERLIAMSDLMKSIKKANPSLMQTQILSIASKKLSGQGKLLGLGLNLAPPRGSGMYLKPYK